MPMTAAQKRAKSKYNQKTYSQLNLKIKKDIYNRIDNYCNENEISKAKLITTAVIYCLDNSVKLDFSENSGADTPGAANTET